MVWAAGVEAGVVAAGGDVVAAGGEAAGFGTSAAFGISFGPDKKIKNQQATFEN